ncbi:protein Son-like [Topomyia yanbarensis]|uniref:protein Son-like n=1 Tax=Topomyia yanbarensis TaxID=2498891 RepID=UPI00273C2ABF|nr:protein Son-like [Topomyia yanbarensis]XP_058827520.1 protein Son-like [Topomyia yanbarensis]
MYPVDYTSQQGYMYNTPSTQKYPANLGTSTSYDSQNSAAAYSTNNTSYSKMFSAGSTSQQSYSYGTSTQKYDGYTGAVSTTGSLRSATQSNYTNNSSYSTSSSSIQPSYNPLLASYTISLYSGISNSTSSNDQEPTSKKSNYDNHWVKRDFHRKTTPYTGEKGMNLLQKMGWMPGEGLGKQKNGSLEPHLPYIKVNKRGLDVSIEKKQKQNLKIVGTVKKKSAATTLVTEGKHPISILAEYCSKQRIDLPIYRAVVDEGPIHAKNYVFKVIVNGIEYEAETGSHIKKSAQSEAAKKCLQQLGLLP